MLARKAVLSLMVGCCFSSLAAQDISTQLYEQPTKARWRPAVRNVVLRPEDATSSAPSLAPEAAQFRQAATQVSEGSGELPRKHGQIWREYNIKRYTSNVTTTNKPQQSIIDWILRETGTDVWHEEPVGLLSANRDTLYVYHTEAMHRIVKEVVDRFVGSAAEQHVLGVRLATLDSPNWRTKAFPLLTPIGISTPGLEAWLISKENAALLLGQLRKRSDFNEHASPSLVIHNGQSQTLTRTNPRNYVRSVNVQQSALLGQLQMGRVDEGYSLQVSPLVSLDERTIDAVIKCEINQVEQFVPISIDVPTPSGESTRVQVQVPQMVSWSLHERFRWPTEQVLVIGCGVIATPTPERQGGFGLGNVFSNAPGRADALLFIESKGTAKQVGVTANGSLGVTPR